MKEIEARVSVHLLARDSIDSDAIPVADHLSVYL